MARTKSQIGKIISDNLSSSLWQTIKLSLLGKELISYATELVYAN